MEKEESENVMDGAEKAKYLKIASQADRVTVAPILFANGYSVQPVKQRRDGKSFEYLVKYWVGQPIVEDAEVPK